MPDAVSEDCLFCGIAAGRIPATEVGSNDRAIAFRDISPQTPTHVLVIPRRHIVNASTIEAGDGPDIEAMFLLANDVARKEGVFERGFRLVYNVGEDAMNSVPHLHMHLLAGRRLGWPPG